jgi:ATP-dependent helicase HepA
LRPGAPLIEVLARLLRWDDRGTAFATWRVAPKIGRGEIWLGFRLCFVIEPDFPERDAVLDCKLAILLRRKSSELVIQPLLEPEFKLFARQAREPTNKW